MKSDIINAEFDVNTRLGLGAMNNKQNIEFFQTSDSNKNKLSLKINLVKLLV
jgi:hypothetical protein